MWAVYIVVGSTGRPLDRGVAGLGVGLAIGAVAIAPFGVAGQRTGVVSLAAACWRRACLVGVFSDAIGYGIDQHVLRRIPIRRFALLLALLPVTAMVIGVHRPRPASRPPLDLVGIALVLAGVIPQERTRSTTCPTRRHRLTPNCCRGQVRPT